MAETVRYVDEEHKNVFLKLLNEQRLEGEHCDIAVVVEDVKFRAHRCVLAACSNYFKKLFKKHEVDNSSVIEIDFIRSDIFEEVLNYMYTSRISIKKRDVNLMMSSGQILGIRFLDKLCSQKRDVTSEEKDKFPYDIVKMALPPEAQLAPDAEVLGDDPSTTDDLDPSANQELEKSPNTALRVQEALILKELATEEVHKVSCYDQDVSEMEAEPKEMGAGHHTTQTLSFADSMGEVKDEQAPGWSTATTDMKKHEKLHSADRPFVCEICSKAFTTHAHLKEHLKIHTGFKPYRCDVCSKSFIRAPDLKKHERVHSNERPFAYLKRHENNMHSERKQLSSSGLQTETETLQAAAMAAEHQLDNIACS
ncbi:hypothetical protein NHX12_021827 [Muraenolepis orangiensis]|uniref:Zinc finger and BTB domain-containing protein 14 n=1 Tax=Muraenolepis orangiensis TaxID=630683 RepID=A0A9Q0IUR4_9TELE|nr:hypothetical protein NHX12_021827 [Muraenolepis orangiensis]